MKAMVVSSILSKNSAAELCCTSEHVWVVDPLIGPPVLLHREDVMPHRPETDYDWIREVLISVKSRHERSCLIVFAKGPFDFVAIRGIILPSDRQVFTTQARVNT